MKFLDKLLVAVIILATSFIGYRFLNGPGTLAPSSKTTKSVEVIQGTANLQDTVSNIPGRRHGSVQALTLSMKESRELAQFRVDKTSACRETLFASIQAYPIYSAEVADHVGSNGSSMLMEGGTGCFAKGNEWIVYKVGEKTDDPYLKNLGSSRIVDIFEVPYEKFDETLAQSIGVSGENRTMVTGAPVFSKSKRVVLVSISKPSGRGTNPPGSLPKYPTIGSEKLREWMKQRGKETVFVDVRSLAEMTTEPIRLPAAIKRIPYNGTASSFAWERTVGQIEADRFNASPEFAELVSFARGPGEKLHLFVVGSDSSDGRPIWAMKELAQFGLSNVAWYRDGVKSLNIKAVE